MDILNSCLQKSPYFLGPFLLNLQTNQPTWRVRVVPFFKCGLLRQGLFFNVSADKPKPCSCGWHTKAAKRKQARQASQAQSDASTSSTPTVGVAVSSYNAPATGEPSCTSPGSSSLSVSVDPATQTTSSSTAASTSSTTASADTPKVGSGPVPPKFDRSDFQSPTISELRAIGIGIKTFPGKLDLLVYCPLKGRCPHCNSALITANSVGKRKLCYAIPWPKIIVGVDMRCNKCKKHFMTHDPNSSFRGAGQVGVCHHQGQREPHLPAALTAGRFDCGPSGAVHRR